MIKKILFSLIAVLAFGLIGRSGNKVQAIEPDETYLFAQKDTCDLYLDIYNPVKGSETTFDGKKKPTILFMFGGGFTGGTRDGKQYKTWFRTLTENGYKVISIDYRLGLKGYEDKVGIKGVKYISRAIDMAVEDLFSATEFIISNSGSLGIDPYNIVLTGSSAGAISVLQADYELCNRREIAKELPADFHYAGVISFAGAILSHEGKVKYHETPSPTLMLHGTADKVVNYGQIKVFRLGFFGSDKLAERFSKFAFNYNILRFKDHGHDISSSMSSTFDYQKSFIEQNIILKHKKVIDSLIDDPSIPVRDGSRNRKELYGKN